MVAAYEYYRSTLGYTLEKADVIQENARCVACTKSAISSPAYSCTRSDRKTTYLHKTCSEYPMFVNFHKDHPLRLEDDVIFGEDAVCHACNTQIIGSPTYTCCTRDVNIDCRNFYLHKSCAELPTQVNHHKHNAHPLCLQRRSDACICDVCSRPAKTGYACVDCNFDVCVVCAFEQRMLSHEGHKEHALTLMKKEAFFKCDACYEEAKDSSYVCTTCEFWIHKSCALSPSTIPNPTYHHHPLTLVYSIPEIHRYFQRICGICTEIVHTSYWLYYCQKCTYFVHMKCSTSTISLVNEIEGGDIDNEPDLIQFPLPSLDSIFDIIVTQCGKFQVDFEGGNRPSLSTTPDDPQLLVKHWSHEVHPLQKLQYTLSENGSSDNDDDDDDNDDRRLLICDGCIQPITVSHPSYYACIQCGFFLHAFCATKLPQNLAVGASPSHPNHSLLLRKTDRFYISVKCGVCCNRTNGFYYHCQTCDFNIDIRCTFLPTRIKHISHKNHSLVQRPSSFNSICNLTRYRMDGAVEYACETCSSFRIRVTCLFYPSRMEHRYDIQPITLRYPPFFYEGVFYCEICEEQVDNQRLLYHCSESDHSFHYYCFRYLIYTVKLGGTIDVKIGDKPHTLTLVVKQPTRKTPTFSCPDCFALWDSIGLLFECDGCGYLLCYKCATVREIVKNLKPDHFFRNEVRVQAKSPGFALQFIDSGDTY